ncbi:AfsR/SARP family transcriptional regulator [Paractinoplanes abujensis]|uniref:DNA-binding SARP family transcriptional activator n=1 Tax=Paractinoplanes abujensis TaxID=882441 RepID=A0A7W7CLX5_9ACTN|nr:bacterial transcriptional activator domain-containing protein [Actinoplanes abujensis]MBB4690987.1 DNA-binding SARP family transcriptional activator [Actinoplanes abujensis]
MKVDVAALSSGETVQELCAAADLYRGDLLEGRYDDWVLQARDECRRRMVALLARLVPLLDGDAIRYAEQYRALDRLAEEPYRQLIRLHHATGDRARAVRTFHECASALRDEPGVGPRVNVHDDQARAALIDDGLPPVLAERDRGHLPLAARGQHGRHDR